jgi:hypothetical protein
MEAPSGFPQPIGEQPIQLAPPRIGHVQIRVAVRIVIRRRRRRADRRQPRHDPGKHRGQLDLLVYVRAAFGRGALDESDFAGGGFGRLEAQPPVTAHERREHEQKSNDVRQGSVPLPEKWIKALWYLACALYRSTNHPSNRFETRYPSTYRTSPLFGEKQRVPNTMFLREFRGVSRP